MWLSLKTFTCVSDKAVSSNPKHLPKHDFNIFSSKMFQAFQYFSARIRRLRKTDTDYTGHVSAVCRGTCSEAPTTLRRRVLEE